VPAAIDKELSWVERAMTWDTGTIRRSCEAFCTSHLPVDNVHRAHSPAQYRAVRDRLREAEEAYSLPEIAVVRQADAFNRSKWLALWRNTVRSRLHGAVARTRMLSIVWAPSPNCTVSWRHCFPKLRMAVWLRRPGLPFVRRHLGCHALLWADSTILPRVSANTGGTRQLVSWDCVGTGIEAQVHGSVVLTRDVERLVADPAFTGTSVGRMLNELAAKYGFELQWHCGPSPIVRPKYAWRPNIIRTDHRFPACDGCVNEALIS